ncbi:MAG: DNA-processing protein DprA [Oscillospiraceae bacterium]|jgi:DNA processing protein|nr:DNA-processing protein DprA [Oscillospiraceae bacterium]
MLKHWVWLTTRKGIGIRGRAALLRLFDTAETIYEMSERDYLQTEGFDRRWLESLLDKSLDAAQEILTRCDDEDIRLLTYAHFAYPERLKNIADPPAVLYYQGTLPDFDNEAVIGIVGSRKCSAYGLLHAKQFSKLISGSGGIVVSGGARGIDTMSLRGALDSPMPIVCVVGNGLDIHYPPENRFLFREIRAHGCMISEYPPGTRPERGNFPVRNRLISGLSLGVLVVEAPERSGALITANHALEQGRDVFAIPGNLGVKHCEGSNRLLRDGAIMAENGWDVLSQYTHLFPNKLADARSKEVLQKLFDLRYAQALPVYSPVTIGDNGVKEQTQETPKKPAPQLTADERAVLSLLSNEAVSIDTLVIEANLPSQRVLAAITMLQIKGLAQKLPGNRCCLREATL